MKHILKLAVAAFIFSSTSCKTTRNLAGPDDGKIEVVFMQVNDVYEIAPLSGGTVGGMARVASLKKQLREQNPNTFLVMAGDFLSPSVYNSIKYQGNRVRGKQMVEAMNVAGMDYAVFGNHEFDINETELQERINESGFKWISSNTFHQVKDKTTPFARTGVANSAFDETYIMTVRDQDGTTAKIGFIGLTLPFNKASYVSYTDPLATAKVLYNRLKDSVDAVVAITHQLIADDEILAKELPGLTAILGGHEHDMRFSKIGNVYITKAHANAKSAYVVKLMINKTKSKISVKPELKYLDQSVALDSSTNTVVQKWMEVARDNYASLGFDALKVVLDKGEPLDGRETEIRSHPTNLTRLIVKSMEAASPQADLVIMNSGSIRVDDILPMPLIQYDILRSLPYGGGIREVDMKGSLLTRILEVGRKNTGLGGYLQISEKAVYDAATGTWKLDGAAIDGTKTYRVALSDFLLTGGETNLDFLTNKNPELVKSYDVQTAVSNPQSDIRLAIVKYLEAKR
jgi:2',3'-cyclic-nucleotide 2'-phosphodiesterase (5'-nucleotidase family)